ncbi:MAG: ABC transporter substrate-binding protein [Anaerolineae bacterium]|nr:ABC transporter substrate-binding protein [Anaerolineae bacterium]
MKQKYPRLLFIGMALLWFLAACSSPSTTESPDTESETAVEPTDAPAEPTEEPEMEEAEAGTEDVTIGMMVIAPIPALETVQESFIATLAEGGYVEGENLTIIRGNAEGDIATLNTIAQQFIDEGVDLIVTTSTPAAQAALNATQDMADPIPIIFTTVTDPYAAGIATAPDEHPAWMTGSQMFPPLEETFDTMLEINPDLTTIGFLYNPAEANSVAQTEVVQQIADERGITLEIATVSNSSEIRTAAESLAGLGIDFFYFTQDSTVASGSEAVVQVANDNGIPIITNDIPTVAKGGTAAVGASLREDGRVAGEMAVAFLNGEIDLATTDIQRVGVFDYFINRAGASAQGIELPASLIERAIDQTPADFEGSAEPTEEEKGEFTIGMMVIASVPALELVQESFIEAMAEGGYVEGENLTIIRGNAEGDIATLNTIAQQFIDENVDLIVTTSTPAAQAALNATQDMAEPIPIIFTTVTDPYAAGIATAPDDHPAWMTGSQIFPPLEETFDTMLEINPDTTTIGFLYNPAEANSVAQTEAVQAIADERGITLEIATVSNSSEIRTAAESLAGLDIDFFYFTQDSTVASGSEAVVQVANEYGIPIITNDIPTVAKGGAVALGASLAEDGRQAGEMAVAFLDGTLDIATTDIQRVGVFDTFINRAGAEAQGIELPQSLIDRAIDQTPE